MLLDQLLKNGALQARGAPIPLRRGWQYAKGGEPHLIPSAFWRTIDVADEGWGEAYWELGAFCLGVLFGKEPRPGKLENQYVQVEVDWAHIENLLHSEDVTPPLFAGTGAELSSTSVNDDPRNNGRPRSADWNQWIATVADRARRGAITNRTKTTMLITSVRLELERMGMQPPSDRAVWDAAAAVLRRLHPSEADGDED